LLALQRASLEAKKDLLESRFSDGERARREAARDVMPNVAVAATNGGR